LSGAPDALVDFHTGEKSARLDAAQKEILAIGKERWVEKVEETRMIRKMARSSGSSAAASSGLGK
jgi:hypothetical protein